MDRGVRVYKGCRQLAGCDDIKLVGLTVDDPGDTIATRMHFMVNVLHWRQMHKDMCSRCLASLVAFFLLAMNGDIKKEIDNVPRSY